jgi:hypothetical protein
MELFLVLKILFVICIIIALYAVIRNLDIIKIILIYWKDLIFDRK